jgi:hypothetical protein
MWKISVGVAALIVALLFGWFFLGLETVVRESAEAPEPYRDELVVPPVPLESTAGRPLEIAPDLEPIQAPAPDWVLPPLNQSDPFVREQLAAFELPETWTRQEELVRRLAVLVENASRGEYPRRQLGFLVPSQAFRVEQRGEAVFLDPLNYQRFDALVDRLETIDPRTLGRLLRFLRPLVAQSLVELGVDAPPGTLLREALRQVQNLPSLPDEIELVRPNVFYQYADPALESLSPLQKQVLRTGPRNVARLQVYLQRLAAAMGYWDSES